MHRFRFLLPLIASLALSSGTTYACPRIGFQNNVDFNCDLFHRGVMTGDSIAKGVGDEINDNEGGYVKRVREEFTDSKFINLGFPGSTTERLLRKLKVKLNTSPDSKTTRAVRGKDFIIIDIGRNDFFEEDYTPTLTVRNLRRIVKFLKKKLRQQDGSVPFIVIATLLPTNRPFQATYLEEVNNLLMDQKSDLLPAYLRYDKLAKRHLSSDGLHPSSRGYDKLAGMLSRYLRNRLQRQSVAQRPDLDEDGIYDRFERGKFGTDKNLTDTDGDGVSDGDEVFTLLTDPLDPTDPAS